MRNSLAILWLFIMFFTTIISYYKFSITISIAFFLSGIFMAIFSLINNEIKRN